MAKKTISRLDYNLAIFLLEQGRLHVMRAGNKCKQLISLLDDVEPGACTDAVFGGHTDIDELLSKLGIVVEE